LHNSEFLLPALATGCIAAGNFHSLWIYLRALSYLRGLLGGGRDEPRHAGLYLHGEVPNQLGQPRQPIRC